MKVTIIHGQNHKETSYHAGHILLEKLKNVENINVFFLPKDMPEFCLGCYQCMLNDQTYCPHYHVMKPISEAILQADLLILTTPVYVFRASGSMKAFLDHYFVWWDIHRPQEGMYLKKAVIISSGAGSGMKKAIQDIRVSLSHWGISHIETYAFRSQAITWKDVTLKKRRELDRQLEKIVNRIQKQSTISLHVRIMFLMMRLMHKKNLSACQTDYDYWKGKGWLEKNRPWKSNE